MLSQQNSLRGISQCPIHYAQFTNNKFAIASWEHQQQKLHSYGAFYKTVIFLPNTVFSQYFWQNALFVAGHFPVPISATDLM